MEQNSTKTNINWYPGHMAKTKREISEKINLIDIVFEVIDSRIPISSKNNEITKMIGNKPRILVMTKSDLCDKEVTLKWKEYYEKEGYNVVLVDLIHDKNLNSIMTLTNKLAKELNEKRKAKGLKPRKVRILILGIPNVGKSTLINKLVGKKATNVGNRPGVTKSLEWIRINENFELLDTPGILPPHYEDKKISLNLALLGSIKEDILPLDELYSYLIKYLKENYPDALNNRYKVDSSLEEYLLTEQIAKNRGLLQKGGTIDEDSTKKLVLKEFKEGILTRVVIDNA